MTLPVVKIKAEALERVSYLYKDVEKPTEKIPNGSLVAIHSASDRPLGQGFYNGHSRVQLRVLDFSGKLEIDDAFFVRRLEAACDLRDCLEIDSNAYRLVNSEGDSLPGLVIDRFNELFVIEFFASGMFKRRKLIQSTLAHRFPNARFYSFSQRHVQKQESFDHYDEPAPAPEIITEHGIKFNVHPGTGHKTGFFLDQRENRLRLGNLAKGKRVLDLCCHAGGFSLYAKRAGATSVLAVDRDPNAIEQAKANAALNEIEVDFQVAELDAFLSETPTRYDVIVLDPPKQTKSSEGLYGAKRRYLEWNKQAFQRLGPGGILVSCSCTGLVKDEAFADIVFEAARRAGRNVRLLGWSSAAPDHPFSLYAPETHYLKVAWVEVIQ